jgi:hypothetical protein
MLRLQREADGRASAAAHSGLLHVRERGHMSSVQDFTPWEITNIVWALAKMAYQDDELLGYACERIKGASNADVTPIASVNLLWSMAVMSQTGIASAAVREITPRLVKKILSHVGELTPQSVANATWAGTRIYALDSKAVAQLACRAAVVGADFKGKELAMWAQAAVQYARGARDPPGPCDAQRLPAHCCSALLCVPFSHGGRRRVCACHQRHRKPVARASRQWRRCVDAAVAGVGACSSSCP